MNNFIELSQEEQKLIINNTAEKMKIANAVVEKDFWVCFVLDYLFSEFKYKFNFSSKQNSDRIV